MQTLDWWKGAVIYQIYPRSFQDTNNDGIGDIQGIIERLDYIKNLGVDAIWVSPFFKSPMKDFGYDISDYRDIDSIFGQLADFDELISEAHQRNIKVIIDQVLSHTSNQHDWFIESRENLVNDKADWYVWADAKEDGTAPNNWLSIFGGSAWQWEPRRKQYYLHNFLTEQPDLNFHNPEVRQAVLDNVDFWLKKGVDGFRLDAINFCYHDHELKDNPAKPVDKREGRGFSEDNPYAFQYHYYNNTQPENLVFMQEIRSLLNQYPGTVSLGEISSEDSLTTMAEYTADNDKLHMGYSFELLTDDYSAGYIRNTVQALENQMTEGWPCWAFSNHDVCRVISRWSNGNANELPMQAKMLTALLTSLRGSVCLYQGEELGLPEADLLFSDLQDPYGITFWPTYKGRDGCRTPMPWQQSDNNFGFSEGKPWLPVASSHKLLSVDQQEKNQDSILNANREFLQWRKKHPALMTGTIEFIECPEPILAFWRTSETQKILCCFNLSAKDATLTLDQDFTSLPLETLSHNSGMKVQDDITIAPYGCYFSGLDK
jgi:alpha-glucosidase